MAVSRAELVGLNGGLLAKAVAAVDALLEWAVCCFTSLTHQWCIKKPQLAYASAVS
jgi:hypothetical protein